MSEANDIRRFARLRTLCEGAWELPAADRPDWVRRVCEGDETLIREVEELLRRAEARGSLAELFNGPDG